MSRLMSRAILPSEPASTPHEHINAASRSRWACQGASGQARPSSCARALAISNPRSPKAASVPLAPPNCRIKASPKALLRRLRLRCRDPNHPAALSPNVIGGPPCRSVRPSITVGAYWSARRRAASSARAISVSSTAWARLSTSTSAVSATSWLVAPQ